MNRLIKIYLLFVLAGTGCTNLTANKKALSTVGNPSILLATFTSTYTHTLKNVLVQSQTSNNASATPPIQITLTTDTSTQSYQSLVGFCGSAANPCSCELNWTEVSTVGGQSTSYTRTKKIPINIANVQSGQVSCTLDNSVWNEIPNGTTITMNIIAVSPNISGLNVQSIGYKKGTSVGANGDFLDDTLTPFRNIHRYTCFTKHKTPYQILNQYVDAQPTATPASGSPNPSAVLLGSKFCTGVTSGSGTNSNTGSSGGGSCATPRNGWSAQSYYRNFYIRSDNLGQINSTNANYDCMKVEESLLYSACQSIPASDQGKYYPLDTTFALATTYSSDWSVGVRAASILNKSGDPNSVQTACVNEDQTKRMVEAGTIQKCLGYAKRPSTDGTCGTIKDSNGRIRPLTRLRRYRVVLPPVFQANGAVTNANPAGDEVYVADRLVVNAQGVPTGSMIYGPKPCNYAWFDHEGVTTRDAPSSVGGNSVDFLSDLKGDVIGGVTTYRARPGYIATNDYQYKYGRINATPATANHPNYSVNPDGLVFPNLDLSGGVSNPANYASCSATLPIIDFQMGAASDMRLITASRLRADVYTLGTNKIPLSEVHIQPIDPWTPNYVEDTSFSACVPISDPYVEPPLHFYYSKDAKMVDWCAEVYPTQNPYWADLNTSLKPTGVGFANVVNYTAGGVGPNAQVQTYTSHQNNGSVNYGYLDAKNACSGTNETTICSMTGNASNCTSFIQKTALNIKTCDRTVLYDPNQQYRGFPLLAQDKDIDAMLSADINSNKGFSCSYSVNASSSKVNSVMPSTGCCGVDNGSSILSNLINQAALHFTGSGHLEPYKSAGSPTSRFCGNPVE